MKKLFLSLLLLPALCAQAWEYDFPTLEDPTAYVDQFAPIAVPSVISPDGTIYQTGLYDQMVMIGDDLLENIATSAYITAIDTVTRAPKWSVGIQGAAHITQIVTDATGEYIYVAGTFADDILIGSTDGSIWPSTGTAESHKLVNAFVAKYSKDGILFSVLPILPVNNPRYQFTESDLSVTPTALALYGDQLYLSINYKGGYSVLNNRQYGTIQSAQGIYNSPCAAVLSLSTSNLFDVVRLLDVQADQKSCNAGLGLNSICLTASENGVDVGLFTTGTVSLNFASWNLEEAESYSYQGEDEAGCLMVRWTDGTHTVKQLPAVGTRDYAYTYTRNFIRSMQRVGSKLYIAGNIATALPFQGTLVPDLWTDQFAVCLDAETYQTKWATITGALRDDMPSVEAKYRETIAATLAGNNYIVVGTTNFSVDNHGKSSDYSSDYCLGVSAANTTLALTTKTATGSQLTVSSFTPADDDDPVNPYDVDGDGKLTVSDITELINIYLNAE
ncbi:MAG: hypothetical protein IJT97_02830 [Bacteroidaceae bacterium]|nr:hypothetical protein [Bacteroidaceae bacterium]